MTVNPNYDRQIKDMTSKHDWKEEYHNTWIESYWKEVDKLQAIEKKSRRNRMIERDPNGFSPNAAGAKLDDGKPDLDLVLGDFNRALIEVGKVGTFGARKYSRSGWLSVPNGISRYSSALWRHFFAGYKGESIDKDSGLLHSAHLAWNALAKLELELREKENDDQTRYS